MKKHIMKLSPEPLKKIKAGLKTIELRLYDDKRKNIFVGDNITYLKQKIKLALIFCEDKLPTRQWRCLY